MYNSMMKSALLLATAAVSLVLTNTAQAEEYRVGINATEVLHLPFTAGAVVIGNPAIADVSVHSQNTLFIMGRGFGQTNLIILDSEGNTLMNADIKVGTNMTQSNVKLIKSGLGSETYSCTPKCLPAPNIGDHPEFKNSFTNTASSTIANTVVNGAASFGAGGGAARPGLGAQNSFGGFGNNQSSPPPAPPEFAGNN